MTQLYMDLSSDVNNKYYLIYPFFPDIWSQGPKVPRSQGPKVPRSQGPKVPRSLISVQSEPIEGRSLID